MNAESPRAARAFVTGLGICTPLGRNTEEFSRNMFEGRTALGPVQIFDTSLLTSHLASTFAADFHYQVPASIRKVVDKATLSTYTALKEALLQSRWKDKEVPSHRVAVVVGSSHAGIESTEVVYKKVTAVEPVSIDPREVFAILTAAVSNVLSAHLGATGPKLTVSSACASSNTALGLALDLIASDQADRVVVAGTDTVSLAVMAGFNALRALSPELNAPFSAPAGLNLGEGAAVFVVERDDLLLDRAPLMEILGYGLSSDAYHITAPDLAGDGARRAMVSALADAHVQTSDIDYLSAHGTGTDANDKAESTATASLFGTGVPTSSPKSFTGHTLGASGIVEAAITYLHALRGEVPPTRNFRGTREGCAPLNYVPNLPETRGVSTFLCNNFGFGGNNSSLVLRMGTAPAIPRRRTVRKVVLVGAETVNARGLDAAGLLKAWRSGAEASDGKVAPFRFSDPDLMPFARSAPMIKFGLLAATGALLGHREFFRDNVRCGIVGGMLNGASSSIDKYFSSVFNDGPDLASAQHFPMTTVNACAGQISIAHKIKGYNTTFCGSSGGFYYAQDLVRTGRQEAVLAVSSEDFTDNQRELFRRTKLEASWAEGAVALVVEAEESALSRGVPILCEIASVVLGQDGRLFGPAKGGALLADAGLRALGQAGLSPADVDAVVITSARINRIGANSKAAVARLFPQGVPVESLDDFLGYSPAWTPLGNLLLGSLLLNETAGTRCVLVLESDLTGTNAATVLVKATPALKESA